MGNSFQRLTTRIMHLRAFGLFENLSNANAEKSMWPQPFWQQLFFPATKKSHTKFKCLNYLQHFICAQVWLLLTSSRLWLLQAILLQTPAFISKKHMEDVWFEISGRTLQLKREKWLLYLSYYGSWCFWSVLDYGILCAVGCWTFDVMKLAYLNWYSSFHLSSSWAAPLPRNNLSTKQIIRITSNNEHVQAVVAGASFVTITVDILLTWKPLKS